MANQREAAIELAKRLVASCHEKTPPPLSTTLLEEVEAREKAEFMAHAFEEGSAEWEEQYNNANKTIRVLRKDYEALETKLRVEQNYIAQLECLNREMKDALYKLVLVKDHKDECGKTYWYELWMPKAWEVARECLTKVAHRDFIEYTQEVKGKK